MQDPIEESIRRFFAIVEADIDAFNALPVGVAIPDSKVLMRALIEGRADNFLQLTAAKIIYGLYVELQGKAMRITQEAMLAGLVEKLVQAAGGGEHGGN